MISRNFSSYDHASPRTLVVCGIERGGTSMLAASLHWLGVGMGQSLDATYEDHAFSHVVRAFISAPGDVNGATLKEAIDKNNQQHELWGFKIPNIFLNPAVLTFLRSPTLIFVFRDTIAISDRVATISHRPTSVAFTSIAALQERLASLFSITTSPALAISYEKAVAGPEAFITELTEKLRLQIDRTQYEAAVQIIQRSPKDYFVVAGAADVIGHIEGFDCGDLVGWAINPTDEFHAVRLQLSIDGDFIQELEADLFREDLWIYCHGSLNHGFRWRFPLRYYDDRVHTICISTMDAATVRLANSTLVLKIPEIFGALESLIDDTLRGWIYAWKMYTCEVWVNAIIDGNFRIRAQPTFPRTDLEPSGFCGAGGLCFDIPLELLDGKTHSVALEVEDFPDWHISGNPRQMAFPTRNTFDRAA